jgi:rhomboid family protein
MVFIPIADENPRQWIDAPYVTWGLVASCTLVFLWQASLTGQAEGRALYGLAVIPSVLFGSKHLAPDLYLIPPVLTLITGQFLHGSFWHLAGNMLFLWIFGDNVEDAMGHTRFLVFYLVCGIAAFLAQGLSDPASDVPAIGASGAIAGVLGAYFLLHPRARVLVLFVFFVFRMPAYALLGVWFAMQAINAVSISAAEAGIAFWAHVAGFVAGLLLIYPFKLRHAQLWSQDRTGLRVGGLRFKDRNDPRWGPWGPR